MSIGIISWIVIGLIAGILGSFSALLGIYLSYYLDLASGAAIILVATALFFLTLALTGRTRKLSAISRE